MDSTGLLILRPARGGGPLLRRRRSYSLAQSDGFEIRRVTLAPGTQNPQETPASARRHTTEQSCEDLRKIIQGLCKSPEEGHQMPENLCKEL